MMKKILALLLCFLMIWGMTACKAETTSSKKKKPTSSQKTQDEDFSDNQKDPEPSTSGSSEPVYNDLWENEEGLTVPEEEASQETPEDVAAEFIGALCEGDWDTVSRRLPAFSSSGSMMQGGIMEAILKSIMVTSQTVTDNGDGSYNVELIIETIDYKGLLESLPDTIQSKEAARREMLRLAPEAAHREFTAVLILRRYTPASAFYAEPTPSFLNAITGGYYDLYIEIMGEVLAQ